MEEATDFTPFAGLDVDRVREVLLEWYEESHREFPWRETSDPWAVLVCEVMSQQTQLERVIDPWDAFLEQWPTPAALATDDQAAVVAFWSDHRLGYNNRARYLHEAAEQIVSNFDGEIPSDPESLEQLTGVGPYTANAVASFAFDAGGAVVDTNVKRVLYRAFGVPEDDSAFEQAASIVMPEGQSRAWNNAIMELGGVACRPTPRCDAADCPLRTWCEAYRSGDFTAPDVTEQPEFEGSRRQFRGRVIRVLAEHGTLSLDELGPKVRDDYAPDGQPGQDWLIDLLSDLASEDLVTVVDGDGPTTVQLRQ